MKSNHTGPTADIAERGSHSVHCGMGRRRPIIDRLTFTFITQHIPRIPEEDTCPRLLH